jgi:hypothetical protein
VIPIHPDLHAALVKLARLTVVLDGPVIQSERGGPMTPVSIVCWFASAYRAIWLQGCSSHSGRRTFITRAARLVHNVPVLHCETCNSWLATNQSRPLSGISTSDAASQIDEAASSSRPAESEPPPHLQAAFFSALMFSRDQFGSRFFWSRSSGTASFLVSLSNLTPLWATRHSIVAIFFVIAYREQPRAKTAENR